MTGNVQATENLNCDSIHVNDESFQLHDKSVINSFATLLLNDKGKTSKESISSESIQTSDDDDYFSEFQFLNSEECVKKSTNSDIQLNMRPTLPRRQFEIPRFSPIAAWRTLSSTPDNNQKMLATIFNCDQLICKTSSIDNTEKNIVDQYYDPHPPIEDRIVTIYREPILPNNWLSEEACVSVASAADPLHVVPAIVQENYVLNWTPQQDLSEDSSSEEMDVKSKTENSSSFNHSKHLNSSKGHIFSLSLPRESHLPAYNENKDKPHLYNSLQKLKYSVTGAFGASADVDNPLPTVYRNDNWVLARCTSNLLENNKFSHLNGSTLKLSDNLYCDDYENTRNQDNDDDANYDLNSNDETMVNQNDHSIEYVNKNKYNENNHLNDVVVQQQVNTDIKTGFKNNERYVQIPHQEASSFPLILNHKIPRDSDNIIVKQINRPRQQKMNEAIIQPPSFSGMHLMYLPNNSKHVSLDDGVNRSCIPLTRSNRQQLPIVEPLTTSTTPPQPLLLAKEWKRENLQDSPSSTVSIIITVLY